MDTWPISVRVDGDHTFIGIPDRLGDGRPYRDGDTYPTLEEIGGEDWSAELLAEVLPRERAWAWWTRTEVYRDSQLPLTAAPAVVDPRAVAGVVARRLLLRRMTLAILPADLRREQDAVMSWAGVDTEQIPDCIWTAPDGSVSWNVEEITSWCDDPGMWGDMASVTCQPAERIVVMFDSQVSIALASPAAEDTLRHLDALALRWGLRRIPGPPEYSWVERRR